MTAESHGAGRISVAARTHQGVVRSANQDVALIDGWAGTGADASMSRDLALGESPVVVAVVDGMGGHAGGALAAWTAAGALAEGLPRVTDASTADAVALEASDRVADAGRGSGMPDMGAAFAALRIGSGAWSVVNVGDCRVYRLSEGVLGLLTVDDVGPSHRDPQHLVLTQALGGGARVALDAHWYATPWRPATAERFLLASDGLESVERAEVIAALGATSTADAADALVDAALGAGAPDNVTVIVVDVQPFEPASPNPSTR